MNTSEALMQKYAAHPQIRRIARHRQVTKHVYNARKELRTIREKSKRKYVQLNHEYMDFANTLNGGFNTITSFRFAGRAIGVIIPSRELYHTCPKEASTLYARTIKTILVSRCSIGLKQLCCLHRLARCSSRRVVMIFGGSLFAKHVAEDTLYDIYCNK